MSCDTRRVGKAAFFAVYVPRASTRVNFSSKLNLRLFCSPADKKGKLHEDEVDFNNVWLGDGSSLELMNPEDKAYVFFSGEVLRSEEQTGKFAR